MMSGEDRLPDDKESRLARKFEQGLIEHMRRSASEAFEQEGIPEGIRFAKFFSNVVRHEASAYGGGPLRRLVAKYRL